jgi:hypothetical protein
MQKRLRGVSAAALALTCLTVTGCGTAETSSPLTNTTGTSRMIPSNPSPTITTYPPSNRKNDQSDSKKPTSTPAMHKSTLQLSLHLYPTPLRGVIEWVGRHMQDRPGAPTMLPHTELKGFPAAVVRTIPDGWLAEVYLTTHPFKTNSPQILKKSTNGVLQNLTDWELGPSWSFSVRKITDTRIPAIHSKRMNNLLSGVSLNTDTEPWRSWPHHKVSLGHGIVGTMYQLENYSPTLVWDEGDWTFILPNSLSSTELQAAHAMVSYMNVRLLPPSPGVASVQNGVHGSYSSASFMQGKYIIRISMAGVNETNEAVGVLRMAVHWKSDRA